MFSPSLFQLKTPIWDWFLSSSRFDSRISDGTAGWLHILLPSDMLREILFQQALLDPIPFHVVFHSSRIKSIESTLYDSSCLTDKSRWVVCTYQATGRHAPATLLEKVPCYEK